MAGGVGNPRSNVVEDALSYEGAFSVDWHILSEKPDNTVLDRYNEDNLRVLAAVALLDEQRMASAIGDDVGGLEGDVARLHLKMNLLVDLLAFLVRQQVSAPPVRPVRLSWRGVAWQDPAAKFQPGPGVVSLHLHPSVPQPFRWPAQLAVSATGEWCACFEPLREACQTALERHVFLHHRRAIAGQRKSPQG